MRQDCNYQVEVREETNLLRSLRAEAAEDAI